MKYGPPRVTRKLCRLDHQILFPLFGEGLGTRLGNGLEMRLLHTCCHYTQEKCGYFGTEDNAEHVLIRPCTIFVANFPYKLHRIYDIDMLRLPPIIIPFTTVSLT